MHYCFCIIATKYHASQGALETTNNFYSCVYLDIYIIRVCIEREYVSSTPEYILSNLLRYVLAKLNHKNI